MLGKVSNCGLEDFQNAIASAEAAGEEFYRSTTAHQKSALLRKWYELITANEDDSEYLMFQKLTCQLILSSRHDSLS